MVKGSGLRVLGFRVQVLSINNMKTSMWKVIKSFRVLNVTWPLILRIECPKGSNILTTRPL